MKKSTVVATLLASLVLTNSAAASEPEATPPTIGAIPATEVVEIVAGPTTKTTELSMSESRTRKVIKTFEKRTKTKVVWYMRERGLGNVAGCVNPVRKGWIKPNQTFSNTWHGPNGFTRLNTGWRKGDLLCGARKHGKGKEAYIEGTIKRCGNRKVRIYLNLRYKAKKKVKVSEFRSKIIAIKKIARKINIKEVTEQTTTRKVSYVCPEGYLPSGKWCLPRAKDGSKGSGTGTPGQPGGLGAGGSPEPSEVTETRTDPSDGSVCRDPHTRDIVTGKADQFGYCA